MRCFQEPDQGFRAGAFGFLKKFFGAGIGAGYRVVWFFENVFWGQGLGAGAFGFKNSFLGLASGLDTGWSGFLKTFFGVRFFRGSMFRYG